MLRTLFFAAIFCCGVASQAAETRDYPITPVPFTSVHFSDAFWAPRLEASRTVTIPTCYEQCEKNGRMEGYKIAADIIAGKKNDKRWPGNNGYDDSDVTKVSEGAAYALTVKPDPKMDKYLDDIIALIGSAQEPNGYLYTLWTAKANVGDMNRINCHPTTDRWTNIAMSHEMYDAGHMYEAAVAHYQATGKTSFLDIAKKNADLICSIFNENGRHDPPGHEEIEIGLVKLYRATGDVKYLNQAKFFLDQRGHYINRQSYGEYAQDHKPVVDQDEPVGHSVRAGYLMTAMADVAALTGDESYIKASDRLWNNVVGKKLYLTGGVGASGGNEGYGGNYELPNLAAYCETCASIANCYWNQRLFLLKGESKYIDVLERSLYNGVLSGISLDGKTFFYDNPLESDGRHARSQWFATSCCPTSLCRFMPAIPGYVYGVRGKELFANLFIGGKAEVKVGDAKVALTQETRYPFDGAVKITLNPEKDGQPLTFKIRIPGWAQNAPIPSDLYTFLDKNDEKPTLKLNGQPVEIKLVDGYAVLDRPWKKGDVVELNLPMPVRRVLANPGIEDDKGKVALQRGPLVYCVEHPDVSGGQVSKLIVPDSAALTSTFKSDLLGGVQVISGEGVGLKFGVKDGKRTVEEVPVKFSAIPYYAWAHRGKGEMAVWLARTPAVVEVPPLPTIASTSKATASGGGAMAEGPAPTLNDQREPKDSNDHRNSYQHWWPKKGTKEWLQYDFAKPTQVHVAELYWFDDGDGGECRVPASWKLLYRKDGKWVEVEKPTAYGCAKDKYNRCEFTPVTTDGLRVEVQLQEGWSAGTHEWRVE